LSQGSPTQQRGALHEASAVTLLEDAGLSIVTRNFNSKLGELDIVAVQSAKVAMQSPKVAAQSKRRADSRPKTAALHFVEVRYRATDKYGSAAESITKSKQAKLKKTAALFLQLHPAFSNCRAQFDVITVSGTNYPFKTEWIQDAF